MDHDERNKLIARHVARLLEHFSSVQVVAVHHDAETDDVRCFSLGRGSWYERFGALQDVLNRWEASDKRRAEIEVEAEIEFGDDDEDTESGADTAA